MQQSIAEHTAGIERHRDARRGQHRRGARRCASRRRRLHRDG
jgi:hypothetical protein